MLTSKKRWQCRRFLLPQLTILLVVYKVFAGNSLQLSINLIYFIFTTLFVVYRIVVSLVYSSVILFFGWFLLLLILRFLY